MIKKHLVHKVQNNALSALIDNSRYLVINFFALTLWFYGYKLIIFQNYWKCSVHLGWIIVRSAEIREFYPPKRETKKKNLIFLLPYPNSYPKTSIWLDWFNTGPKLKPKNRIKRTSKFYPKPKLKTRIKNVLWVPVWYFRNRVFWVLVLCTKLSSINSNNIPRLKPKNTIFG